MGKLKRYQLTIFATMFVGYACYNLTRRAVSLAMPKLMEEGLQKEHAGMIISCQNIAYAVSKFIGGILSDRISARFLFTIGLIMSGVATLLFSTTDQLTMYCALWFLNGFAQGCGWPACSKILRQWYSQSQFGTYWSVLSASANISGTLGPFLSAFLILNFGWRFSLVVAGAVSCAMGAIAIITLVNSPEDVGLPSFIKSPAKKKNSKSDNTKGGGSIWEVVQSPFLWVVSFAYMVVFCAKTSAIDWGQLYLMEQRGFTQYVGSSFTSSVESGGFVGGILAGVLTDFAVKRKNPKSLSSPRMIVATLFMGMVAICAHLLTYNVTAESSQLWIASIGFIMGAGLYGAIAIFGVVATESAPVNMSGTSHAIVALAANLGAVVSGLPFSVLAQTYDWAAIFLLLEVLCAITTVVLLATLRMPASIGHRTVKLKRS